MALLNPEFSTPNFIPDPDKEYHCSNYTKSSGWTYLMALVMSGNSREKEFNEYIKSFQPETRYRNFNEECKKQNKHGWTAVMLASRNSNCDSSEKTVQLLIPYSDCNLQEKKGWTALMMASGYSKKESSERTVELLIPHSDCNLQDIYGWTSLMMASGYSKRDSSERTVELLIPYSDCNLQTKKGTTALMLAIAYSNTHSSEKTVELLIPYTNIDFNSILINPALMIIYTLQYKIIMEQNNTLKEREKFKRLLKAPVFRWKFITQLLKQEVIIDFEKNYSEKILSLTDTRREIPEIRLIKTHLSLQNKMIKEQNTRLKEGETFKECLKDGLNLYESIITSYL